MRIVHSNCILFWFCIAKPVIVKIPYDREKYIIVPCMNNKLLLMNMQYVNEYILLKEDCDEPSNTNWSSEIDCGEFPLLIYEVLNEYRTFDLENIPRDEFHTSSNST